MKALVVADPWIEMILDGTKTWEMRSKVTHLRGPVALIRKGSGQVVGTAVLVDCGAPLSADAYAAAERRHGIPAADQPWAIDNGYLIPWVLEDARALAQAVPYRHTSGAVTWVVLEDSVARAMAAQDRTSSPPTAEPAVVSAVISTQADTRSVTLIAGNMGHSPLYLRAFLDFIPENAAGGCDRTQRAVRPVAVTLDGVGPHETDITGSDWLKRPGRSNHCFFRERGPVPRFFALHDARDGDIVDIARTGSNAYTVSFRSSNRAA